MRRGIKATKPDATALELPAMGFVKNSCTPEAEDNAER